MFLCRKSYLKLEVCDTREELSCEISSSFELNSSNVEISRMTDHRDFGVFVLDLPLKLTIFIVGIAAILLAFAIYLNTTKI